MVPRALQAILPLTKCRLTRMNGLLRKHSRAQNLPQRVTLTILTTVSLVSFQLFKDRWLTASTDPTLLAEEDYNNITRGDPETNVCR